MAVSMTVQIEVDGQRAGEPEEVMVERLVMPSEQSSKETFDAILERLGETGDFSMWRSSTLDYETWSLTFCGNPDTLREPLEQAVAAGGVPENDLSDGEAWALVQRRFKLLLEGVRAGETERVTQQASYGTRRGAVLSPDGNFHLVKQEG